MSSVTVFSKRGDSPVQEDHVSVEEERGIFVVADGFGGPNPGALASKTACQAMVEFLSKEAGDEDATLPFELRRAYSLNGNVLFNAMVHANRQVLEVNGEKKANGRGGASLVGGYRSGGFVAVSSIGACSAWLLRAGEIVELIAPRTYARMLDPFGELTAPALNAPLSALGLGEDIDPGLVEFQIRRGDWLVLQSAGIGVDVRNALSRAQSEWEAEMNPTRSDELLRALEQTPFSQNASLILVGF